jgi:hypothetical protein
MPGTPRSDAQNQEGGLIMAQWTINNVSGGPSGQKLRGCYLKPNGTAYDFNAPDNTRLATIPSNISFPFRFEFRYDSIDWALTINSINPPSGNWMNDKPEPEQEEGSWSAGAGTEPKIKTAAENY